MIDSHPSASPPRSSRVPARRSKAYRHKPVARQVFSASARWQVQLELAPAEIALVYRQGLARGAEVRRDGAHEWRPLVITPELRAALSSRAVRPVASLASSPGSSALERSNAPRIRDTALAALAAERPLATVLLPPLPPPPPPPISGKTVSDPLPAYALESLAEPMADSAPTQPGVRRAGRAGQPKPASEPPLALHARPLELSFVAIGAVAFTVLMMLLVQRVAHWGEVRAQIAVHSSPSRLRVTLSPEPNSESLVASTSLNIPVVTVHDLPMERSFFSETTTPRTNSAASPSVDRAALAGALSGAAEAAQNCGSGPVQTRIAATFAPSGVPSQVWFGAEPPPRSLRACILAAVARSRVPAFSGEPVTVAKNVAW